MKNAYGEIGGRVMSIENIKNFISKDFIHLVIDNLFDLISITDTEFNYIWMGKSHDVLGYGEEELLGKNALSLVHEEDISRILELYKNYKNGEFSKQKIEYRIKKSEGEYLWFETIGIILKNEEGIEIGFLFNSRDITEHKYLEEELKKNEEKKTVLLKGIKDIIFVFDYNLICREFYTPEIDLLFLKEEYFLNINFLDIEFPEPAKSLIYEALLRMKEGLSETSVIYSINMNDIIMSFQGDFSVISNNYGDYKRIMLIVKDITERVLIENSIIETRDRALIQKEKIENIIKGTGAGTWEWNIQTGETVFNENWAKIIGYTLEELEPVSIHTWEKYVHPEDYKESEEILKKVLSGERENYSVECRMKHKDGHWIWVYDTGKVVSYSEDGNPLWMFGTHIDITDQKKYQDLLEEQNKELERFFSINLDLLCIATTTGYFVRVNKEWEKLLGFTMEELKGRPFLEFVHPEDVNKTIEAMNNLAGDNEVIGLVNRYQTMDGNYKFLEWRARPFEGYIYAAARDITGHINMEREMYLEKEQFRTTLLSVGDGVISTDEKGKIVMLNKVAENLTGWKKEDAIGQELTKVFNIYSDITEKKLESPVKKVIKTGEILLLDNQIVLISKDNKRIPIEDSAAPIRDVSGVITGVVIVFRDYSDKKERQKEIEFLSFKDPMTGLYNRRYMEDAIKRLDTKRNLPFSTMVLDVNGLKLTNDVFGHDIGDKLLIETAEILRKSCRGDDIIVRTGGDEYAILLPKTDEYECEIIRERIIRESKNKNAQGIIISLAIGYCTKHIESEDIWDAVKIADNRMYGDKMVNGKNVKKQIVDSIIENNFKNNPEERIHANNISNNCIKMAEALRLSREEISDLILLSHLYDIGEIGIPENIRKSQIIYTEEEKLEMRKHVGIGYNILKTVDEYSKIAEFSLLHHERWDGLGYPKGIKEAEIPLESRILSIADAYESMHTKKNYRHLLNKKEINDELIRNSGKQFDPDLIKIFLNIIS